MLGAVVFAPIAPIQVGFAALFLYVLSRAVVQPARSNRDAAFFFGLVALLSILGLLGPHAGRWGIIHDGVPRMTTPVPAGRRILLVEDEPGLVLTDIHVSSGDESKPATPFPNGCTTMGLTPQEVVSATHVMHTAAYEALEEQMERS